MIYPSIIVLESKHDEFNDAGPGKVKVRFMAEASGTIANNILKIFTLPLDKELFMFYKGQK